jgi:type II secretory pathway pseudopilin PulG
MNNGRCERGFTYLAALLLVAASGAALAAAAEFWSHARQRDKEAELLWIGNQFTQAIGLYYQRSPGSVKRYPEKLDELLEDRRHLNTARYLRKIYTDPITGQASWGLVTAPGGGIVGVHSLSSAEPLRQVHGARAYTQWHFIYEPPISQTQAPKK